MKLDTKILIKKAKDLLAKYKKYSGFVFIVIILGLYSFLVFQISRLTLADPAPSAVDQQVQNTGRIKIDQESINKIQQLEDQSVQVQSLFESARDNPFQD